MIVELKAGSRGTALSLEEQASGEEYVKDETAVGEGRAGRKEALNRG